MPRFSVTFRVRAKESCMHHICGFSSGLHWTVERSFCSRWKKCWMQIKGPAPMLSIHTGSRWFWLSVAQDALGLIKHAVQECTWKISFIPPTIGNFAMNAKNASPRQHESRFRNQGLHFQSYQIQTYPGKPTVFKFAPRLGKNLYNNTSCMSCMQGQMMTEKRP